MTNEYSNEFEELLNQYLPAEGEEKGKVKGRISQIDRDYAYLDAQGQPTVVRVRSSELGNYNVGDEIEVIILGSTDEGEFIIGSRKKIEMEEGLVFVEEAFKNKTIIPCLITKAVNGGYIGEYKSVQGFLPKSLSDISPSSKENIVGKTLEVIVKDVTEDRKGKKIIVSRRDVTSQNSESELKTMAVGNTVEGEIVEVLDFGINVKVGALRGFIHISEVSWKKLSSLKNLFKVGDKVKAKIVSIDEARKSLKLSIKALEADPFEVATSKLVIGSDVEGTVKTIAAYGIFVEVAEGVEGLVHVSDLAWGKRKVNVSEFVNVGDKIQVKIMEVDKAGRKLKLGIKQLKANPWDAVATKYPVGTQVSAKVLDIKPFGFFAEIEDGLEVFVHQSDYSWTKEEKPELAIGQNVKLVITEIDNEENKLKGSIKNLTESPWAKIISTCKVGDVVEAEIKTIMDFGVFVKLEKGVDGFIPTQLLSKEFIKNPKEKFQVGDKVKAEIVEIDNEKQKIKLSAKKIELDAENKEEKELLEKYSTSSSAE